MNIRLVAAAFVLIVGNFAGNRTSDAQVVQLPTYHYFSYSGSVLVPDQGETVLGSVKRASSGRNEFGAPFLRPNVGIGSERAVAGAAVSADVHDFEVMDQALLRQAGGSSEGTRQPASGYLSRIPVDQPLPSVAQLRRQQSAQAVARENEALDLFHRGQKAQAAGKPKVAAIFYRMAARQATGKLAEEIRAAQSTDLQTAARR
jgi:hypothetical protein